MAKRAKNGYSVSDAEFRAWKNGVPGARAGAKGNMVAAGSSGCLVVMAAAAASALIGPAALLGLKRLR
jgi:hypothetical protein